MTYSDLSKPERHHLMTHTIQLHEIAHRGGAKPIGPTVVHREFGEDRHQLAVVAIALAISQRVKLRP